MQAIFADIDPGTYRPHALHSQERMWPETNCYVDLWIEVLNALGLPPEAMLGFTLTQDYEGDQFTFFKVPLEDLDTLYGITCTELAIYDRVESHIAVQIGRRRLCLVEMDSYFMPDTASVAYRIEHGKTTIAVNQLDMAARRLGYFHNGGYFELAGEDFDGLFQTAATPDALPFLPYTEFAKFPGTAPSEPAIRAAALDLLPKHFNRRPDSNPFRAFSKDFPAQVEALAERPFGFFHKYAFNTLRQFGANFELAASHFQWLYPDGQLEDARLQALRISEVAKTVQFQLARAVSRKKFDALSAALDPAADAWDAMMGVLEARIG